MKVELLLLLSFQTSSLPDLYGQILGMGVPSLRISPLGQGILRGEYSSAGISQE